MGLQTCNSILFYLWASLDWRAESGLISEPIDLADFFIDNIKFSEYFC